mgnify:FL=1|tara:strand:+ start:274 stop:570 length:297 start_codon:yes stop_codon:yes gene_type:complete
MAFKILTTLDHLRAQSQERLMQETEQLKKLIMEQNHWATERMFEIGYFCDEPHTMWIDLDGKTLTIDGEGLGEWLYSHCKTSCYHDKTDKNIVFHSFI